MLPEASKWSIFLKEKFNMYLAMVVFVYLEDNQHLAMLINLLRVVTHFCMAFVARHSICYSQGGTYFRAIFFIYERTIKLFLLLV